MSTPNDISKSNSLIVNNNMPTKQATRCDRKMVFITVCKEKPRRRASSKHRHYLHHTIIKQELTQQKLGGEGKGYDRRAQLLHYSRRLRESARSSTFKALQSTPTDQQIPSNKIVGFQRKKTYCRTPGSFDKWRMVVPGFMRCLTSFQSKKNGAKEMEVLLKTDPIDAKEPASIKP